MSLPPSSVDTMPFRLQYASNLFVDLHRLPFEKLVRPNAPHLALLGNISKPWSPKTYSFLNYCAKHWETVLWVPGPHELTNPQESHHTVSEAVLSMKDLAKEVSGVQILNSKEAVFQREGVVALGTPLWTQLTPGMSMKGEPEFTSVVASVDEAGPILLTRKTRNQWHKEDRLFLKERSLFWTIVRPDVRILYLTHTLPTPRLLTPPLRNRTYLRLPMDCDTFPVESPVTAWIGGATGSTKQIEVGSKSHTVSLAVNSLYEYPFLTPSLPNKHYDPECVLEIETHLPTPSFQRLVLAECVSSLVPQKVSLGLA